MFISVDLPEPEGPITATKSPVSMSRSTPFSARKAVSPDPNVLVIWRSLMIGASFTGACPSCRDDLHSGLQIAADHLGLASVGSARRDLDRSEEHTSELQSQMRISYAV